MVRLVFASATYWITVLNDGLQLLIEARYILYYSPIIYAVKKAFFITVIIVRLTFRHLTCSVSQQKENIRSSLEITIT